MARYSKRISLWDLSHNITKYFIFELGIISKYVTHYDTYLWKVSIFMQKENWEKLLYEVSPNLATLFCILQKLLFLSHSLSKALVSELGELLNDLNFLSDVRMTVEAIEIMLELSEVVRTCVVGIVDLLVVNTPRLVGL